MLRLHPTALCHCFTVSISTAYDNDVILESDVVLQDTREPKIMNNGEKHQERVVMYMPESRCMIPIIAFHVISIWN